MSRHHLSCSNGYYYYRIKIPVDIKHLFPSTIIKKSLKTTDIKAARCMAVSLEYKVQQTFTMLRTGMLSDDLIRGLITELYPRLKSVPQGKLLSSLIDDYVKANEIKWTHKTKIEIMSCHRLILDVMGDAEVTPPIRVSLLEMVVEVLDAMAGVITERKVDIHLPDTDLILFGDRPRLSQIWQNLIDNAIKYSHTNGIPY